ncbi:hypothetical protein SEA_ZAGIE_10 [Microbacterium phage Zagie]|nr:hypothetical protein SEA_ZAGIE_10 [Microbacterium phage Zagie]
MSDPMNLERLLEMRRSGPHPEPERAEGETRVWSTTLGVYLPSLDFAKPVGHDGDHYPGRISS